MSKHYTMLLPFPISVNRLYGNNKRGRHKTKAYKKWFDEAQFQSLQQKPFTYFTNRVDIIVSLGGGRKDADCDNFNKCPIDFLVFLGIIQDDCKPFVRSVKAIWVDDVKGCQLFIEECE